MTQPERLAERMVELELRARAGVPPEELRSLPPSWDMAEADAAARQHIASERWARAIPRRFLTASMDDLAEPLASTLRGWAQAEAGPNLALLGPVGTGKTHAACAAVRPLVERGASLAFWPVVRLLDQLRPGREPDPYEGAVEADVLVLDDLGAERATEWTAERLYAIVNDRWLAEKPTVVTANLSPPQLSQADERLASRLLGGATIARLAGRDRRMGP